MISRTATVAALALGLAGCGSTTNVRIVGDCPGRLAIATEQCNDSGCTGLAVDEIVTAEDTPGCVFVTWTGSCGASRSCPAKSAGDATFRRTAWPLELDASGAEGLAVSIEPDGGGCTRACTFWIPVGATSSVVATSATGLVAAFTGDCDVIDEDRCTFLGDRARRIQVASSGRRVTVRTQGPGTVRVDAAGLECGPDSSCAGVARLDVPVEAVAAPLDTDTDLVTWTLPSGCTGLGCVADAAADFDVTFVHRVRLTLVGVGDGTGSVAINGTSEPLPYEGLWPTGSGVVVGGQPAVDDVVAGFTGLPCEPVRFIDECRFQLLDSTSGSVRFHRFFDWLIPAGAGTRPGDVLPRDAGFLVALDYGNPGPAWLPMAATRASAVAEVRADGTIGRTTASRNHALASSRFVSTPDGGILVAGPMYQAAVGTSPRSSVVWASIDASVPDRSQPEYALLAFDEARFEPSAFTWPPATFPDSRVTLPARAAVDVGEGRWAFPLIESGGTTDAGVQPPARYSLAAWSPSMALVSEEPLPSTSSSLAATSVGPALLFVANTGLPAASCAPTVDALPYLARTTPVLACGALFEAAARPGSPNRLYAVSPLLAHDDALFFESVAVSTSTGRSAPVVHRFSNSLTRAWELPLEAIERRPPQPNERLRPARLLAQDDTLVAVWTLTGNSIAAVRSPEGLTVACPEAGAATTTHLLLTTHDLQTGRMEWGLCLSGEENGVGRFSGIESSSLSAGTMLVPGQAFPTASTPLPTSIHFGSQLLPIPSTVGYLLALRPPLN